MSWLDIFKRKPRISWRRGGIIVNDLLPQTGYNRGQAKKTYTAKEVAGAVVDDDQVQRLVQVITAKAYVSAQWGHASIGHSHENATLLRRAGNQLVRMGYNVRFTPGGEGYSPYLSISW